eukprot:scaffold28729_cov146-Isochrysis_galbana.AAC.2
MLHTIYFASNRQGATRNVTQHAHCQACARGAVMINTHQARTSTRASQPSVQPPVERACVPARLHNYVDGHESHERKEENGLTRTHGDTQGDRVGRVQWAPPRGEVLHTSLDKPALTPRYTSNAEARGHVPLRPYHAHPTHHNFHAYRLAFPRKATRHPPSHDPTSTASSTPPGAGSKAALRRVGLPMKAPPGVSL